MPNAIQYAKFKKKCLEEPEIYKKEKERINNINKSRYANDLEFRQKCLEYQRNKIRLKKEINNTLI